MRIRPTAAAAVSVVSLLALSACGSDLSPDLHPGSAAVIGEDTISISEIDDRAEAFCVSALPGLQQSDVALPMSAIRGEYVRVMSEEALARQYADSNDVDVKEDYRGRMDMIDQSLANPDPSMGVPEELRPALRDYNSRRAYSGAVETAVGLVAAQEGGQQPTSPEEVEGLGRQVIDAWAAEKNIDTKIDPRFDLDGKDSTSLSFAVSDLATLTLDPEPDAAANKAYLETLPAGQKCG